MKFQHLQWIRTATNTELQDLALKMIMRHPETFEELANLGQTFDVRWGSEPYERVEVHFDREQMVELAKFASSDKKIACIKRIREIAGIGLKEAKELSEHRPFCKAINAGW
jgi:ribosomal protein L7/L12